MGSRPATGREIRAARGGAGRCENGKKENLSSAKRDIAISIYCTQSYSYVNQKMMIFFTAGSYSFCIRPLHLHY